MKKNKAKGKPKRPASPALSGEDEDMDGGVKRKAPPKTKNGSTYS